jgi:hypothetical protein
MNQFSRILTVFVTVLCVLFMGVTAVTTATWTDWRQIAQKQFPPGEISKQKDQIQGLEEEIRTVEAKQIAAEAAIQLDKTAFTDPATGREVALEKRLAEAVQKAGQLFAETEIQAKKVNAKLDELKLRRQDTVRLQNEFDELVSQKLASQAEAKRLRDLLFQARAVLERAEHRRQLLQKQLMSRESAHVQQEARAGSEF